LFGNLEGNQIIERGSDMFFNSSLSRKRRPLMSGIEVRKKDRLSNAPKSGGQAIIPSTARKGGLIHTTEGSWMEEKK